MQTLLKTKVQTPRLRANRVERVRLFERLDESLNCGLGLISAPAGYGKTTLLVEWCKHSFRKGWQVAWFTVDELDNDPARFFWHLIAAFQQIDASFGTALQAFLQTSPAPFAVSELAASLVNEIADLPLKVILALDDLYWIANPEICKGLNDLIQRQPHNLVVVIATREDPPLPMARLRARQQVVEVRTADLAFTEGETETFLREIHHIQLTPADLTRLEKRTEGWPAGLQMAAIAMQQTEDQAAFIRSFTGDDRHIVDYLVEEVLSQQPENVRDFLLQTSIFDQLCGALCEAAIPSLLPGEGQKMLDTLEKANIFLVPLDHRREWYRFHHLFAALLNYQLRKEKPDLVPLLHERTARWLDEHGYPDEALAHAFALSDLSLAVSLLERCTPQMITHSETLQTMAWFQKLPEAVFTGRPFLSIMDAWVRAFSGNSSMMGKIEDRLQAAEQDAQMLPLPQRDQVLGHAVTIRAYLARSAGLEPQKAIDLSLSALKMLQPGDELIESVLHLNLGVNYLALADIPKARKALNAAGLTSQDRNLYVALYAIYLQAGTAIQQGHLHEAVEICQNVLNGSSEATAPFLATLPAAGAVHLALSTALTEWGQSAEAQSHLKRGLELILLTHDYPTHIHAYTLGVRLALARGDYQAGLDYCRHISETGWRNASALAETLAASIGLCFNPAVYPAARAAQWIETHPFCWEADQPVGLDYAGESRYQEICAHIRASLWYAASRGFSGIKPHLLHTRAYLERQIARSDAVGTTGRSVELNLLQAQVLELTGEHAAALQALRQALEQAEPGGYLRIFIDQGPVVRSLLQALAQQNPCAYLDKILQIHPEDTVEPADLDALTEREIEVIRLLSEGHTAHEMAGRLSISVHTIRSHVKSIYSKLGVGRRYDAVRLAKELGLIE